MLRGTREAVALQILPSAGSGARRCHPTTFIVISIRPEDVEERPTVTILVSHRGPIKGISREFTASCKLEFVERMRPYSVSSTGRFEFEHSQHQVTFHSDRRAREDQALGGGNDQRDREIPDPQHQVILHGLPRDLVNQPQRGEIDLPRRPRRLLLDRVHGVHPKSNRVRPSNREFGNERAQQEFACPRVKELRPEILRRHTEHFDHRRTERERPTSLAVIGIDPLSDVEEKSPFVGHHQPEPLIIQSADQVGQRHQGRVVDVPGERRDRIQDHGECQSLHRHAHELRNHDRGRSRLFGKPEHRGDIRHHSGPVFFDHGTSSVGRE